MAVVHKGWIGYIYHFISLYGAPRRGKKKKEREKQLWDWIKERVLDTFTKKKLMSSIPRFQRTHTFKKWDEEKISKSFWIIPNHAFLRNLFSLHPQHIHYTHFALVMYIMILDNVRWFHDFFLIIFTYLPVSQFMQLKPLLKKMHQKLSVIITNNSTKCSQEAVFLSYFH